MTRDLTLEDFVAGDRWVGEEEILVTPEEIMAFAREYDPQPFHIDPELARTTPIGQFCQSGWQTAAYTMKLLTRTMGFLGIIGGTIHMSWPTPTLPGDRLHVELEVVSVRESKTKPDRGVVELSYDTLNQAGEVRQHTETTIIAWKRENRATADTE
ncbi:MAG: MaoC family dehydratase N-terminal domain-containing protein [Propionibacteriaceae bacterium]|jgi:acyl dehydratase|nr:MaoC family dehydratase N-terminal domain-containing protein [Propionibacteriaceae bacterium]